MICNHVTDNYTEHKRQEMRAVLLGYSVTSRRLLIASIIHVFIKCGIQLLIHSQTSVVQQLKFAIGSLILSYSWLGDYLSPLRLESTHVGKRGLWILYTIQQFDWFRGISPSVARSRPVFWIISSDRGLVITNFINWAIKLLIYNFNGATVKFGNG